MTVAERFMRFLCALALLGLVACAPTPQREGTGEYIDDTIITGKVKAAFLDAKELQVASIKVITERGVVFLMGRVTETESNIAAHRARSVGGVQKVVKVFEIITPAELAAMPIPPAGAASAVAK